MSFDDVTGLFTIYVGVHTTDLVIEHVVQFDLITHACWN